jgi:catechol 2,3-dioxygenase-like lactoylglutathione lyase family enzyme
VPDARSTDPHGSDAEQRARLDARRAEIAHRYLLPRDARPVSSARGVHHVALISSDVERTVQFFDGVLGFPLVEMFENRDYAGSTHFFFDIGIGNTLAYFDLPGLDLGPYAEVLGGHHHLAISMTRPEWEAARSRLEAAGVAYDHVDGSSLYFRGPDGERLELISDPLLEMYGHPIG